MATYVRELSIADTLRGTVQIYGAHFLSILGIYFLPVFPAAALQTIAQIEKWKDLAALGTVLALILQLVAQGALTIAVSDVCLGYKPSAKRSYRRLSAAIIGRLIATGILAFLVIGVAFLVPFGFLAVGSAMHESQLALAGMVLLGLAGIFALWFLLSAMFIAPIVVLEGHWGFVAIKRSRQLAKGYLLRNIGAFVLLLLTIMVASGLLGGLLALLFSPESREFSLIVVAIQHLVAAPLGLILVLLLYYDLRARKEGYNMTTLAEDLMD
jgi:hypothetical protein